MALKAKTISEIELYAMENSKTLVISENGKVTERRCTMHEEEILKKCIAGALSVSENYGDLRSIAQCAAGIAEEFLPGLNGYFSVYRRIIGFGLVRGGKGGKN